MCDCIEVKQYIYYINQTEPCWIILIPRPIETYVWNPVSDSWQIVGSSPLSFVTSWNLTRIMNYHIRILKPPFLTPTGSNIRSFPLRTHTQMFQSLSNWTVLYNLIKFMINIIVILLIIYNILNILILLIYSFTGER